MYQNIINPENGKLVSIQSKLGKNIINNYISYLKGGRVELKSLSPEEAIDRVSPLIHLLYKLGEFKGDDFLKDYIQLFKTKDGKEISEKDQKTIENTILTILDKPETDRIISQGGGAGLTPEEEKIRQEAMDSLEQNMRELSETRRRFEAQSLTPEQREARRVSARQSGMVLSIMCLLLGLGIGFSGNELALPLVSKLCIGGVIGLLYNVYKE